MISRNRALKLTRKQIVIDLIPVPTREPACLSTTSYFLETSFLVRLLTGDVELERQQHDVVQAQGIETEIAHELYGFGAIALTTKIPFTNHDPQFGCAMNLIDLVQVHATDGLQSGSFMNRKIDNVLAFGDLLLPILLRIQAHHTHLEESSSLQLIDPAVIGLNQSTVNRPECDLVSSDDDVLSTLLPVYAPVESTVEYEINEPSLECKPNWSRH